jgi:hypothetical protein
MEDAGSAGGTGGAGGPEGGDIEDSDAVVAAYPLLSAVLVFVVAVAAWVGISVALGSGVDPVTTVLFAGSFTAVYVGFSIYAA